MSNMRNLLEKMDQFAGQSVGQKPGDQVRGTERANKKKSGEHPFKGRLVGGCEESAGSLLKELQQELNRPAATARRDLFREFAEYRQGVTEVFDQPYKTKSEKSMHSDVDMLAKLPDGTYLSIMFNNEGNDEWQVEFYRNNSQDITGEGDAQRVFATVLTSMQKFIKKYKPWRLIFSAKKDVRAGRKGESRARLYNRLVQRYATAWGYEEYSEDHGDAITYELTRLKKGVTEEDAWHSSEDAPQDAWHSSQDAPQDAWHSATSESQNNPADAVSMDVPLLIRIMEYAREDAKTDQDLHNVAERLTAMSADGSTLGMDQYDAIVGQSALDEEITAPVTGAAVTPGAAAPAANPAAMAQMKAQQLKTLAAQKKTTQDQIKQTQDQLNSLRKQLASLSNPANIAMPGVTGTAE